VVTVFRLRLAPRKIGLSQAERLRSGSNLQWFRFNAGVRRSLVRRQRPLLLEYWPPTLIFLTPILGRVDEFGSDEIFGIERSR
jgi:hypothetical protein